MSFFKKFFTKRRIIWTSIIVLVVGGIGWGIFRSKNNTDGIITEAVKVQDLKSSVLATGQVTSNIDLSLSFKASGIVRKVNVKVGDKTKAGQILATLDQKDQSAALTSARGSLAAAQANYQKVLSGTSSEEIDVAQKSVDAAQVNVDNTKAQQKLLVENAYRTLLSSGLTAETTYASTGTVPTITGIYSGTKEGLYTVRTYQTGSGNYFSIDGLETGSQPVIKGTSQPMGTKGLYINFPEGYSNNDTWTVEIPNKKSSSYLTNYNAYQSALNTQESANKTAQASLDSAIATLNLKKAQARPADVQAAQAQVLSAQGQVQTALAALESTQIVSPSSGTVTSVDLKVGELVSALKTVVVVQDVNNLYLEADISEANIAALKTGQRVDVTFDALSPDLTYSASIASIDPASTVISGVVNYKIKALLDKVESIRPGMTANMSVMTGEKKGVLAAPLRSVVSRNGKKYIRVITNPKNKTYQETEVTTGFEADGGLVEISSGLSEGQEIVTFINNK